MTCFDGQLIRRLTLIQLDECAAIPLVGESATPAVKGLAGEVQTFTTTRQVDQPADNRVKVVTGATCSKPRPAPTDRGIQVQLLFCGGNPVVEAAAGYKTLDLDGSDIVGFEDPELTGTNNVLLEVIFEPTLDSCSGGGSSQSLAVLFPYLEQWIVSGDAVIDGEQVPDLQVTAQTANGSNPFTNYNNSGELPTYLSHWADKFDDIATGRSWRYSYLIDPPTIDTSEEPCAFAAIDSASS